MNQTNGSVIYFPTRKKHSKEKGMVVEWIRNGYQFRAKSAPNR
jgi:hypothetical protein